MAKKYIVVLLSFLCILPLHGMEYLYNVWDLYFGLPNRHSLAQKVAPLEKLPTELLIAITEQAQPEKPDYSPADLLCEQIRMICCLRITSKLLYEHIPLDQLHITLQRYHYSHLGGCMFHITGCYSNIHLKGHNAAAPWLQLFLNVIAHKINHLAAFIDHNEFLSSATIHGNIKCMRILLNAGANPNVKWCPYLTPLYAAKNKKQVALLYQAGADINYQLDWFNNTTPLHYAARRGDQKVVSALLQAGAHIDLPDLGGNTALHHAAKKNHKDVVITLLQAGARNDLKNNDQQTAAQLTLFSEQKMPLLPRIINKLAGIFGYPTTSSLIDIWPIQGNNNEDD